MAPSFLAMSWYNRMQTICITTTMPTKKTEIKLGEEAKDSVTGFKGIVSVIGSMYGGEHRVYLQPVGVTPDGDMKKGHWFSWGRLTDEPTPTLDPIIGQERTDEVTLLKGKVTGRQLHLKGCILVEFQPLGFSKEGLPFDEMVFDEARVEPKTTGTGPMTSGSARQRM